MVPKFYMNCYHKYLWCFPEWKYQQYGKPLILICISDIFKKGDHKNVPIIEIIATDGQNAFRAERSFINGIFIKERIE